jgi:hypothetical protein
MLTRPRLVLLSALLTIAAPSLAHAEDPLDEAVGRALFNEGVALFNQGKYEAACPKLEASLKEYPGLGTRGKLAECYEKIGRYGSAWQTYRDVAQLAGRGGDPKREQVASARAAALESKLSYLTISVWPGDDVPGLVVKRGGRELEHSRLGAAELVDATTVYIEASAPGRKPFFGRIDLKEGHSARFEVPALEPLPNAPAAPVVPVDPAGSASSPPASASNAHADVASPAVTRPSSSWQKPVALGLVGAGVVAVGVGAILGLSARSTYDGAFDGGGCERGTNLCDAAGQSAVDDARGAATLSTVFFAAGGGLAAAGAVLFFTSPTSRSRAIQVHPAGYAGGGGLVVGGTL